MNTDKTPLGKMMQIAEELLTSLEFDGTQYMGDEYVIDGELNTYKSGTRTMMSEWRDKLAAAWPEPLDMNDRGVKTLFRTATSNSIVFRWNDQCLPRYTYRNGVRVRIN